jgi:hypothetical protein
MSGLSYLPVWTTTKRRLRYRDRQSYTSTRLTHSSHTGTTRDTVKTVQLYPPQRRHEACRLSPSSVDEAAVRRTSLLGRTQEVQEKGNPITISGCLIVAAALIVFPLL